MTLPADTPLPIDEILPELLAQLAAHTAVVLEAPPGAGKTTRVPLALLQTPWLAGRKVLMLEPRRLAARAAAARMAATLGESLGETVGYHIRGEHKVGPQTRIEVVTEGILTRRLLADPELSGVGAVLFDEIHERSLQGDLGLALCLEVREAFRPDLRLLPMSATLDGAALSALLGGAPRVSSGGRLFPVEVRHLPRPAPGRLEAAVLDAVRQALEEESGSLLVFLPGEGEIRKTESLLEQARLGPDIRLAPLFGALPPAAQDRAIRPAEPGTRKIVLATDIAETSLTIEGIRVIIDGGLRRAPRFDPGSGMTRLETRRIAKSATEQRRGRAGRLEPGVCYRLWPAAEQAGLLPQEPAEILDADLAPLALDLARWGAADPAQLAWLDPPPPGTFAQARELLAELGALDSKGQITRHGEAMADLGTHPRLAHMMLRGKALGQGALACLLAALLEERDIFTSKPGTLRPIDLRQRVAVLLASEAGEGKQKEADLLPVGAGLKREAMRRVATQAKDGRRRLRLPKEDKEPVAEPPGSTAIGRLLALAYPDRVAERRPGSGGGAPGERAGGGRGRGKGPPQGARYLMRGGRGAQLAEDDPLAAEPWLAIADVDAKGREARVYLAAPLDRTDIEALFGEDIVTEDVVEWDKRTETVLARRRRRLGALTLETEKLADPSPDAVVAALCDGLRRLGLEALPWSPAARNLRARIAFLQTQGYAGETNSGATAWPDLSDAALLDSLADWLGPALAAAGIQDREGFAALDLEPPLLARLDWEQRQQLDRLAPSHVQVPSGSRLRLDYGDGSAVPVLAVKLQEMFGCSDTPTVLEGRQPVLLHLLSPGGQPVQVTSDLAGFWRDSYAAVKAELRGRYQKHPWPDDPLEAEATRRTKKAMDREAKRTREKG